MPVIELHTRIAAPIERCFDLARSIGLHVSSLNHTGERAVAGVTHGLISLGEEVTWEATHFGVRQRLTSRITAFDRPRYFQDAMVRGAFASFEHDHFFEASDGETLMRDMVTFRSPLGPLGALVDRWVLAGYLRRLLERRNEAIRVTATSGARSR